MRLSSNTQPAARRPPRPCRSHLHTLRILSMEWEQQSPLLICGFDITREAADALLFRRPKVGRLRTGHITPAAGWSVHAHMQLRCAGQLCAGSTAPAAPHESKPSLTCVLSVACCVPLRPSLRMA